MYRTKFSISLISIAITVLFSCQNRTSQRSGNPRADQEKEMIDFGTQLADTIIYPVDIMNLDSTDDWKTTRLKNLQYNKLTDKLFEALYSGKLKATDYYSGEEIPTEEIKKMEESGELDRNKIAQIQFEEAWYFNSEKGTMTKQVQSVMLAWPIYTNQGEFFGFKAGFVLEFGP